MISESVKIKSFENIYFIFLYGVSYGAITLSRISISDFNVPNTSLLFKIEKNHDIEDNLTEGERKYLGAYLCQIKERFEEQFPHIQSSLWFGYTDYHQLAIANLPSRALFRKYPEIFTIGQIIILSFVGFLFIYLILGRYSKRDSYSKISRLNTK